jgi:RNA polymerase sigma-70 factor (ECF subfamily)
MLAIRANGQPAAAAYQRTGDGTYEAYGLGVLSVTNAGMARILVFGSADLVSRSGLPSTLIAD